MSELYTTKEGGRMMNCDVCGKPAKGVCCSAFGPISGAYCAECLTAGRETYDNCVAAAIGVGTDRGDWHPSTLPALDASLAFAGKTWAEFVLDVESREQEYYASMEPKEGES